MDAKLEIPISAKVLSDGEAETILVAGKDVSPERLAERTGLKKVEVLLVETTDGKVNLEALLTTLSERKITSILVEGGGAVHGNFFDHGFVDRVYAFIAPKLIGGKDALSPVGGMGCLKIGEGIKLERVETVSLGSDFLITGCTSKG